MFEAIDERILEREFRYYGKPEFERLAAISNGRLYNPRRTPRYRQPLQNYQKTRPSPVTIGEPRCPDPGGQPGYLRVDTVHQGDTENAKGAFYLNAVDESAACAANASAAWPSLGPRVWWGTLGNSRDRLPAEAGSTPGAD